MARESWKSIAIALGNAMQNHSYCEDHAVGEPEASCPFCLDRATYNRYRRFAQRNGLTFRDPLRGVGSVRVSEIRRTT